ncbi:ABC transporter G family member 2 [Platanthera zijinensis]|uniref:ABC transporter G family member 2 n=1 Tax=Platanthera zijinensis TaxID=2320716 RepID=A0AAP0B0F9_9ASPA
MSLSQSVRDRITAVRQRNRAKAVGLNKIPARAPPSLPLSASPPKKTKTPEPHILAEEPSRTYPRGSTPPAPASLKGKEVRSSNPSWFLVTAHSLFVVYSQRFLEASQRPETIRINISELPSQRLSPQDSTPSTPVTKRDDPSTASDRTRRFGASGGPAESTLAADSPAEGYSGREAFSPPPPVDEIDDYLGDPADPIEMKRKVAEMLRKHALLIQALEKGKQAADHRIDWLEMECVRLSNEIDVDTEVDQTDPLAILNDVDQQLRLARRGVAAARAFHFPRRPPCVRSRGGRWRNYWRHGIVAGTAETIGEKKESQQRVVGMVKSAAPWDRKPQGRHELLGCNVDIERSKAEISRDSSFSIMTGTGILKQQVVTDMSKWSCLVVTLAWGFFFRALFYLTLLVGSKNKRRQEEDRDGERSN